MAELVIKPVTNRRDLRRFIAFPNKLFKDVPSYIPALDFDEVNLLTDKKMTVSFNPEEPLTITLPANFGVVLG